MQGMQGGARRVIELFLPSIVDHVLSHLDRNGSVPRYQSKEKQRIVAMIEEYWKEICDNKILHVPAAASHENDVTIQLRTLLMNRISNTIVSQLLS
jgi:hypothetical protein